MEDSVRGDFLATAGGVVMMKAGDLRVGDLVEDQNGNGRIHLIMSTKMVPSIVVGTEAVSIRWICFYDSKEIVYSVVHHPSNVFNVLSRADS